MGGMRWLIRGSGGGGGGEDGIEGRMESKFE